MFTGRFCLCCIEYHLDWVVKCLSKPVQHLLVFVAGIVAVQLLHGSEALLDLSGIGKGVALNVAFQGFQDAEDEVVQGIAVLDLVEQMFG